MNHSDYEQLAAGYVLGALEPDDEHVFQQHLGGCPQCEASVRELEEVVGELVRLAPDEARPVAKPTPPRSPEPRPAVAAVTTPAGPRPRPSAPAPPQTVAVPAAPAAACPSRCPRP